MNDFLEKGRKSSVNRSDHHVTVSSTGNIFLFSTWNTYRRYPANKYCTYGLINHFITTSNGVIHIRVTPFFTLYFTLQLALFYFPIMCLI